jgi:hypothetical protein
MLLLAGMAVYVRIAFTPSVDCTGIAKELVTKMSAGDFVGAENDFDNRMKSVLPPDRLQSTEKGIVSQFGPIQRIDGAWAEHCFIFEIVHVTTKLTRNTVDIKVVFSTSGKISGLWIAPTR